MNITSIVAIVFYFAIIIVPFVIVVRGTLQELSRVEAPPEGKSKKSNVKVKKKKR